MRFNLLLALLSIIPQFVSAQSKPEKLPAFGKVEKADLEMKEYAADPKAEAVVLFEEGSFEFVYGSGFSTRHRIRIKILNDKGFDQANVVLHYLNGSGGQAITNLEAQSYNLDDKGNIVVTKVDKKLIYDQKENKRVSKKSFTFPEVRKGTIIEYRYKKEGVGMEPWYFQRSIPVKYSAYTVDFPQEIETRIKPHCVGLLEMDKGYNGVREVKTYFMKNVPAFKPEPYIINEDYYRDHITATITAFPISGRREYRGVTWPQVIRFLMEDEDFGLQIKKTIPRTDDLDAKLKTATDALQKLKIIYQYVQKNMTWNEYDGIWASEGIRSAWKDKKGTTAEINLILVNLLKDAGIDAHPVLVSTHENGIVNTTDAGTYDIPGYLQFDKVMAYVTLGNRKYVMDATKKEMPFHLIPSDVIMTEGLVIEKIETFEWGWKKLWANDATAKNLVLINCTIDGEGMMKGEAAISSYDYARIQRLPTVKKGKDKFIEAFLKSELPITVEEVVFENAEVDTLPLTQKVTFSQNLNSAGEYRYFSANMFSGLDKNPFIADKRTADVFFGNNQKHTIMANFQLPDGYEIDAMPKNIKMIMPDTSISIQRSSSLNGNLLMTMIQLELKKPVFSPQEYPDLQAFFNEVIVLMNEQYVLRKKK